MRGLILFLGLALMAVANAAAPSPEVKAAFKEITDRMGLDLMYADGEIQKEEAFIAAKILKAHPDVPERVLSEAERAAVCDLVHKLLNAEFYGEVWRILDFGKRVVGLDGKFQASENAVLEQYRLALLPGTSWDEINRLVEDTVKKAQMKFKETDAFVVLNLIRRMQDSYHKKHGSYLALAPCPDEATSNERRAFSAQACPSFVALVAHLGLKPQESLDTLFMKNRGVYWADLTPTGFRAWAKMDLDEDGQWSLFSISDTEDAEKVSADEIF